MQRSFKGCLPDPPVYISVSHKEVAKGLLVTKGSTRISLGMQRVLRRTSSWASCSSCIKAMMGSGGGGLSERDHSELLIFPPKTNYWGCIHIVWYWEEAWSEWSHPQWIALGLRIRTRTVRTTSVASQPKRIRPQSTSLHPDGWKIKKKNHLDHYWLHILV